jgi:hypothetical protein
MYAYVYNINLGTDPPHFKEICNFVIGYQDVFPRLQAEFQPVGVRVGEVLEKIVTPALRCLWDSHQLRASEIFGPAGPPPGGRYASETRAQVL